MQPNEATSPQFLGPPGPFSERPRGLSCCILKHQIKPWCQKKSKLLDKMKVENVRLPVPALMSSFWLTSGERAGPSSPTSTMAPNSGHPSFPGHVSSQSTPSLPRCPFSKGLATPSLFQNSLRGRAPSATPVPPTLAG